MPTTLTVKQVIQAELLKVCLAVTKTLREQAEKKKKKAKYTDSEIARMRELIAAVGWDVTMCDRWMELHSILMDAPELKLKGIQFELFCVFVCEKNANNHRYTTNVPYILTRISGIDHQGLDLEGTANTIFRSNDVPRYASDDEVAYCIRNLNEKQLRFIHTNEVFKTIMDTAMNKSVSVEDESIKHKKDNDEEDNGEVTLPGGRTITVGD